MMVRLFYTDIINIVDKKIVDTNDGGKGNPLSSDDVSTTKNIPLANTESQEKLSSTDSYSSDNLDTDYLKAVNNGDMETVKKTVDDCAVKQDVEWEKQRELIQRNVENLPCLLT